MADDPAAEEAEELETGDEAEDAEEQIQREVEAEETGDEPETEDETEADGEAEAEEGDGEAEEVAAKPSRGANLRRRAQEAESREREKDERLGRLERELEDFRRQGSTRQTAEDEARERERVALMSPEERTAHEVGKVKSELRGEMQQTRFLLADQADKTSFEARAQSDPLRKKYQDRVERELQAMRKNGMNVERNRLFRYLVGEDVDNKRGEAATKQRRKTETVRQRETVRQPGGGRSDRPAARGKAPKTPAERLKDVTF